MNTLIMYMELTYLKILNKNHINHSDASVENTIELIKKGVMIEPLIPVDNVVKERILSKYGFDVANANSAFYKSFEERLGKSWNEVVVERIVHYLTHGEYEPDEISEHVFDYINKNYIKIQIVEPKVIAEKLETLVNEPLALPSSDIPSMLDVLSYYNIETVTGNKELQIMHACRAGYVLSDPHLFLRQLNYLVTDRTMLIKSARNLRIFELNLDCKPSETLNKIAKLIENYADNFGLENLAKHFRPNKKLWLMIRKHCKDTRPIINEMKRLSERVHVDHTQYTVLEKDNTDFTKLSTYQLIKTFNFVREYRLRAEGKYIRAFKVRNGRTFVKESTHTPDSDKYIKAFKIELQITNELKNRYKNTNKKVFLNPESHVDIKMPTSGKSFTGPYPMFSSVKLSDKTSEPIQVGIYWNEQADLDLHAKSVEGHHVGFYSEDDNNIVYSGDMTRLNEHGYAAESMLVKNPSEGSYIFTMQPYNSGYAATFTLFVGSKNAHNTERKEIINPDELKFTCKMKTEPITLGTTAGNKFILTNMNLGGHLPDEKSSELIIPAILLKERAAMTLKEFCDITELNVTQTKEEIDENTIDFSEDVIATSSFTSLLEL